MNDIKAMLFDLGGVVIDWNPRHLYRKVFGGDAARMEFFLTTVCPLEWNELQDAGRPLSIGTEERVREYPEWEAEIRAYYDRWVEMIGDEIPESAELLGELSDARIRLFALSNWSLETFPLVRDRFSLLARFERIFLSGEAGVAKPDPRFYEFALRQIDVPRNNLLFVDDNLRNVEAARTLMLPSIQFRNTIQLRRDLRTLGVAL
jgi:2-haloacid dehalogenase